MNVDNQQDIYVYKLTIFYVKRGRFRPTYDKIQRPIMDF